MNPASPGAIELLRVRYLRGPNVWAYRAVLEVWLDLGRLEDFPSNTLEGFNDRLLALLPALAEHHCGVGERGGFLERLREGTWLGHVLEHCVIEMLNLAGMPTGFGQTRGTSQRGVYRMVFRARDERVALSALAQGHALLHAAIDGREFDVPAAVAAVRESIDESFLGPSTACIVAAATERNIPHIRLNDGNLVQLGNGARQHRIWTAESDLTCAIAETIARDKDLTKSILRSCGVPVPDGVTVASADEAWAAARDFDVPVVIKPADGNHGRGVTLDLTREQDIRDAFELAERHGSSVLVERYIRGDEHRLLVVGGQVVAAARGETAWVTGDGHSTVRELVDSQINTDPRRGLTEAHPLNILNIAEDGVLALDLKRQGITPETVLEAGRRVLVQRNGNVAIDCTDDVHPDVAFQVSLAARAVGLDIAGVDLVCEDIAQPLHAQGGAVVEVNAGPGLLMHLKPALGQPRPVGRAIVDHLFPADEDDTHPGRIPIVGICGSRHASLIARAVAWLIHLTGQPTALACRDGLFLGSRRVGTGGKPFWDASRNLLTNRDARAAVFENDAPLVLEDGLPYDRCHIGVVTDAGGWEALGAHDIHSVDQMHKVLRTQVDVVLSDGVGVLNAADPVVAALSGLCDGEVVMYAALNDGLPEALRAHLAEGGRAAVLSAGRVQLRGPQTEQAGPDLAAVLARKGRRDDAALTEALLAAVAAAWAYGITPELIAAGLETFELEAGAHRAQH